jgi:tetratricopeptide (TPR) repeat protein
MSVTNGRDPAMGRKPAMRVTEQSAEPYRPPMPVIHQIAWISLFLQLLIIAIFIGAATYFGVTKPILAATLAYLIMAIVIRLFLTSHHRRGMHYAREGRLELAIAEFQRSYEFFHRHAWLDEMRYIFLLSTSRVGYREMGLLNLAYCDLWQDRGEDAIRTYLRTIEEFPDSGLAWTGIKLFQQGGHDGERRAAASISAGRLPPSVGIGPIAGSVASPASSMGQTEVSFRGAR